MFIPYVIMNIISHHIIGDTNSSLRECCRELMEDWTTSDNGVQPKTWRKLIDVLSEVDELESVIEDIKQSLKSEGVTFDGMNVVLQCMCTQEVWCL